MSTSEQVFVIPPLADWTARLRSRVKKNPEDSTAREALARIKAIIEAEGADNTDIQIREATQKNTMVVMRRSTADLKDELSGPQQDAWNEIALTEIIYGKYGNTRYRLMGWGRVAGMSETDLSDFLLDVQTRHKAWREHMSTHSQLAMSICERVCRRGDTLSQIKKDERIGYDTARKWLEVGLTEYASVAAALGSGYWKQNVQRRPSVEKIS